MRRDKGLLPPLVRFVRIICNVYYMQKGSVCQPLPAQTPYFAAQTIRLRGAARA